MTSRFPKPDRRHLLLSIPLVVTASVTVAMSGLVTACAVQWLRTMKLERKVLRQMLKSDPPAPPRCDPPTPGPEGSRPHRVRPVPRRL